MACTRRLELLILHIFATLCSIRLKATRKDFFDFKKTREKNSTIYMQETLIIPSNGNRSTENLICLVMESIAWVCALY